MKEPKNRGILHT